MCFGQTCKLHWLCNLSLDTKKPRGGWVGWAGGNHMGMAGQEGSGPGMLDVICGMSRACGSRWEERENHWATWGAPCTRLGNCQNFLFMPNTLKSNYYYYFYYSRATMVKGWLIHPPAYTICTAYMGLLEADFDEEITQLWAYLLCTCSGAWGEYISLSSGCIAGQLLRKTWLCTFWR